MGSLGELEREEVVPAQLGVVWEPLRLFTAPLFTAPRSQLGVVWEPLRLDGRHDEGEVADRHLGSGGEGGFGYRGVGEGESSIGT